MRRILLLTLLLSMAPLSKAKTQAATIPPIPTIPAIPTVPAMPSAPECECDPNVPEPLKFWLWLPIVER